MLDVVRAHADAGSVVRAGLGAYAARNADASGTEARLAAFISAGVGSSEETVAEVVVLAHHRLASAYPLVSIRCLKADRCGRLSRSTGPPDVDRCLPTGRS